MLEFERHRRTRSCGVTGAVVLHQGRSHFIEQLLHAAPVGQGPSEHGHQGQGHVQAAASPVLGEAQEVVGVFAPAGTGGAVGTDAGFVDAGQGALEGWPAARELVPEPLRRRPGRFGLHSGQGNRALYALNSICILTTLQKNARPANPSGAEPLPLLTTCYTPAQLLRHFLDLVRVPDLAAWLSEGSRTFYARAFTPLITLWYLVFQRLGSNHQLSAVQEDARAGGADRLSPPGKPPLSQQLRSEATTSFSDARQRLPLDVCRRALHHTGTRLHQTLEVPRHFGLKLALVDGTTCRFRPLGDLPQQFPPHRPGNCRKAPYWCLARVLGVICWATGVVLDTALASLKTSEQALADGICSARSWQGWLMAADRNFGVYSVARAIQAAQGQALLRLTERRAAKLARTAGLRLVPGLDAPIAWTPTPQDQCPPALPRTPVPGRLLAVRVSPHGFRPFTLYLFTTLTEVGECSPAALARVYGLRWHIELCFRHIKAQMDLGFLECRSAAMARKEWIAGLIAYNLIRWTLGAAAARAQIPVHQLSFSRARELLWGWCLRQAHRRDDPAAWERLLDRVAHAQLPKRRQPRPAEPRALRHFHKDVARLEGPRAAARHQLASPPAIS